MIPFNMFMMFKIKKIISINFLGGFIDLKQHVMYDMTRMTKSNKI